MQIVQTPGAVVVLSEMIHDARIVALDGRPAPPAAMRFWLGSSRGHWDGDTLTSRRPILRRPSAFAGPTNGCASSSASRSIGRTR
jgi:hypothetical protein